ncbi:Arm DNA-binding domain-containing protein, partial [Pseudomonas sp. FW306-02-F02-AB]|uniref:Arm DNA-binding domain-containing protein n=5 Tax=Pseudomonas TaxID=286 RepID=UPI0035323465
PRSGSRVRVSFPAPNTKKRHSMSGVFFCALSYWYVHSQRKKPRKNYSLKDMDGLHLFVSSKGAKSWHFRFNWLGKPARISLGMYPEISLKDARLARDQVRALVAKGADPRAA